MTTLVRMTNSVVLLLIVLIACFSSTNAAGVGINFKQDTMLAQLSSAASKRPSGGTSNFNMSSTTDLQIVNGTPQKNCGD